MARPPLTLKAKALGLVAQREHSRVEMRRKLMTHVQMLRRAAAASGLEGVAPAVVAVPEEAEVDALLDWLESKDLLSVQRFVETRVRSRAQRFGNLRIRQELSQHGVEIDPQTNDELKQSELARARAAWAKRFGEVATNAAERARQARFLAARGFSTDTIRRTIAGGADLPDE